MTVDKRDDADAYIIQDRSRIHIKVWLVPNYTFVFLSVYLDMLDLKFPVHEIFVPIPDVLKINMNKYEQYHFSLCPPPRLCRSWRDIVAFSGAKSTRFLYGGSSVYVETLLEMAATQRGIHCAPGVWSDVIMQVGIF